MVGEGEFIYRFLLGKSEVMRRQGRNGRIILK
jgi:hypothetical protein